MNGVDLLVGLAVGLLLGAVAGAAVAFLLARRSQNSSLSDGAQQELLDRQRLETEALREQRRAAEQAASEGRVLAALAPLQTNLVELQRKVAQVEEARRQDQGALFSQLRDAREVSEALHVTTAQLAGALRSNSVRGAWGEAQLRNIVESSGLLERVDFSTQVTLGSEGQTLRPDLVLHMPGGKSLPVDAKVPFTAYIEAQEIGESADPQLRAQRDHLLGEHVRAVRAHVDALASKRYWEGLETAPDFVVAFIPAEPLLSAALAADPTLLDHAFAKRVALATPVTLWSVLKTVAFAWKQEALTDDAKQLFDLSRELYRRIATMSEHSAKLGRQLESAVKSYNSFGSALESRVLVTARKLQTLDESKVIPPAQEITEAPRGLTAGEFSDG